MIGTARDWTGRHRAEIALSLRITMAALIVFGLGELLGIHQVYWAVLTTAIVMQASVGGSLKATLDRLAGTAIGAVWGVVVAALVPHQTVSETAGGLVAVLAPLALLTALHPSYRVAPVTAISVLLVPHGDAGALLEALERVTEIALGCAVALGVALAFKPAQAHRILYAAVAEALAPVGEQLS